jgi:hypothetical protein
VPYADIAGRCIQRPESGKRHCGTLRTPCTCQAVGRLLQPTRRIFDPESCKCRRDVHLPSYATPCASPHRCLAASSALVNPFLRSCCCLSSIAEPVPRLAITLQYGATGSRISLPPERQGQSDQPLLHDAAPSGTAGPSARDIYIRCPVPPTGAPPREEGKRAERERRLTYFGPKYDRTPTRRKACTH